MNCRGRNRAATPISLTVEDKVCEFVGGTTRVFRLNDETPDGAMVEKVPAEGWERHHNRPGDREDMRLHVLGFTRDGG